MSEREALMTKYRSVLSDSYIPLFQYVNDVSAGSPGFGFNSLSDRPLLRNDHPRQCHLSALVVLVRFPMVLHVQHLL
jgi:hypothetical protein